jgi:hypothetical protein
MRHSVGKHVSGFLFAILLSLSATALAQSPDPAMGTWTLSTDKSRYKPGPPFKSLVVKFEPAGEGVKMTNELINADGISIKSQYTAYYDGKDYPISGLPNIDTVALKKLDGGEVHRTDRKAGTVVQRFVRTMSTDGKTMTIRQTGTSATGEAYDNILVFHKE